MWPFDGRWREEFPEPDREAIARQVRRIELQARQLMDSHALGNYESVFRGHGIEFSEVRAYEPGDPFQAIDWKVSARMRRPYVKRFVEDRELTVLLAVDMSASTGFGTRGRQKRDLAAEVAGVLCLAALRSQDRVGLLLFTDRVERFVRPVRGRNRTLRLLYELLAFRPRGRETDLAAALDTAARFLTVRSLVFVLSDFATRRPYTHELLGLSRRHDVVAVQVRDPAEERLPEAGLLEVEDPETGARVVADLGDPRVREALRERALEEETRLERQVRRCHAGLIRVRTDRPYAVDLASFFAARSRSRRRGLRRGRRRHPRRRPAATATPRSAGTAGAIPAGNAGPVPGGREAAPVRVVS